ncbi:phosphodiester glycosidase family protein [Heliophilum fasciatum]|uniref:Exopolysaccharide biosynthesis protein n=1 Tax=Heliophilum fasciatum TaxID=35700 RepID=A0A4R2RWS0_9FIRM|nr:phosphodiester glycosidase family protein [Heliophilum fasciatum]MCW2277381.1 exopolysaccharide biosynthesis protein [Heliophilum fasciatum]TCP67217.1 exopolysaccharide biosynthesis protein [Heliophilum fasciatum]
MKSLIKKIALFLLINGLIGTILVPLVVFYGPVPALRQMVVGSIATSRHPQVAEFFLSPEQIQAILGQPDDSSVQTALSNGQQVSLSLQRGSDRIEIEDIHGKRFTGKVLIVHEPTRVKVAVTSQLGESGETVLEMARRVGAVAAINAGGFIDPNGQGNGAFPDGVTISNGEFISVLKEDQKEDIIGLTKKGMLIVGRYSARDLRQMDMADVVTFGPPLVVNGRGTITQGDGGWGVAPRAAIGQREDGALIMVTIDGRQVGSIGATLRELQDLLLQYGAVTAGNLDGGASTTMVYQGKVVNQPSSVFGIRYVPTSFVVMPSKRI